MYSICNNFSQFTIFCLVKITEVANGWGRLLYSVQVYISVSPERANLLLRGMCASVARPVSVAGIASPWMFFLLAGWILTHWPG
jgi:hypothetical protein